MNRLDLTARLVAAAVAGTVTLSIFAAVVSIAEPQQSVLTAKLHRPDAETPVVHLAKGNPVVASTRTATRPSSI